MSVQSDHLNTNVSLLQPYRNRALGVGLVGLAITALGLFIDPTQFFRSYLFAWIFWLEIGLGCLAIVMIYHLTAGRWGEVMRRLLESGAMTLPLLGLLFVPLVFGLPALYIWAQPAAVAADPLLQHKQLYLNDSFFLIRSAAYLVIWSVLAWVLYRWSSRQQTDSDTDFGTRFRRLSSGGLIIFGLTVTFAFIDWIMSLEPHWYSTIYSAMVATGAILEAFAFAVLLVALIARATPTRTLVAPRVFNDLGSLLFAFVMVWAYMAFSQFLLIWSGNLPDEITWYVRRLNQGWQWVALLLVLFHFTLPFSLLLSREIKRNSRAVLALAALVLVMRLVDAFWLVMPAFDTSGLRIHWLDLAAPIGIGGVWLAAFLWLMQRRTPLLPPAPETSEATTNG